MSASFEDLNPDLMAHPLIPTYGKIDALQDRIEELKEELAEVRKDRDYWQELAGSYIGITTREAKLEEVWQEGQE